jgi:hypothetical protein
MRPSAALGASLARMVEVCTTLRKSRPLVSKSTL